MVLLVVLLLRDVDPSDPRTLETNTLKLIDFGLARELAKTHLTTDKGTYVYMAPEAIMFNRHSVSSDIWRQVPQLSLLCLCSVYVCNLITV